MQKLIINKFGPIKNCEFFIKDFLILIGEQATGKSIICKSIYFFKSVRDDLKSYVYRIINNDFNEDELPAKYIEDLLRNKFNKLFGIREFDSDFSMKYYFDDNVHISIKCSAITKKAIEFQFCDEMMRFIELMQEKTISQYSILKKIDNIDSTYYQLEKNKIYQMLTKEISLFFREDKDIFYIPAGRGLLSLMTNQLLNIDIDSVDYVTGEFLKLIQKQRNMFDPILKEVLIENDSYVDDINKDQKESIKKILKGEYYYLDNKELLKIKKDSSLQINYTSSGQQEVLWILNLLQIWIKQNRNVFVVIEEPEAHLFPKTQKEVVEYISYFFNSGDNQIIIATHSPYLLTAVNNLLYAGKVGKTNYKKVNEIINNKKWLDFDRFDAYLVGADKERYIKSIVDGELQEIAAEEIDGVSDEIRSIYSNIFSMENENE